MVENNLLLPREMVTEFKAALKNCHVEITAVIRSPENDLLTPIRLSYGGTLGQDASGTEWRWQAEGEAAATVLATAFALAPLYRKPISIFRPPTGKKVDWASQP